MFSNDDIGELTAQLSRLNCHLDSLKEFSADLAPLALMGHMAATRKDNSGDLSDELYELQDSVDMKSRSKDNLAKKKRIKKIEAELDGLSRERDDLEKTVNNSINCFLRSLTPGPSEKVTLDVTGAKVIHVKMSVILKGFQQDTELDVIKALRRDGMSFGSALQLLGGGLVDQDLSIAEAKAWESRLQDAGGIVELKIAS